MDVDLFYYSIRISLDFGEGSTRTAFVCNVQCHVVLRRATCQCANINRMTAKCYLEQRREIVEDMVVLWLQGRDDCTGNNGYALRRAGLQPFDPVKLRFLRVPPNDLRMVAVECIFLLTTDTLCSQTH